MNPEKAIEKCEATLAKELATKVYRLQNEASEIEEQWACLGAACGQRADHAAQLLGRLTWHLADIEKFAAACRGQIEMMQANPFERETAQTTAN